ncbi:efflux RND transporter periplasmic adaptor subunit [Flagellimonas lutaonensis]|nr:efflux RND transporter periplasmic adaptor subunit [Allomuricauda lutaonensis]
MISRYNVKRWLPFMIGVLLMAACGDRAAKSDTASEPIPVSVATVETGSERYFTAGSGQIRSGNSAVLSTRMMGHIERIPVRVGQKVNKDDLLVVINNMDLRAKKAQVSASIIEAKAAFANAKKDYDRFVNLFQKNSASQKELDDMTARYEMAKARLQAAEEMEKEVNAQFAYVNIRAPFKGVVTNTFVDVGEMANPGMPLVGIEAPGALEVVAKIPENKVGQLREGMTAMVTVKVLDTVLNGTLTELSTSASNTGGQYLATVELKNPPASVLSGMYATVAFPVENTQSQMLTVPKQALVERGQLTGIYTVGQNNTAILRWLRLGDPVGDGFEVLSGLSGGETYIVSYQGKLFNGAKVAIQ